MTGKVLALTDDAVLPISTVFNAIKELEDGGVEKHDPQLITQVSLLSNFHPLSDLIELLSLQILEIMLVFHYFGGLALRDVLILLSLFRN